MRGMPGTGLDDVTVVYPNGGTALDRVSLTADQGEILAVLGREMAAHEGGELLVHRRSPAIFDV